MNTIYHWQFPLPRTHTGMLQGNGRMGVMIWGEGNQLRLTIGRADFWDHRGGSEMTAEMSYQNVRDHLSRGRESELDELFRGPEPQPGQPNRPTVLPLGRVDLEFDATVSLRAGRLHLADGRVEVELEANGVISTVVLELSLHEPDLIVQLPAAMAVTVTGVPAWTFVGEQLAAVSFRPPTQFNDACGGGWVQNCPADPAMAVCWRRDNDCLAIVTRRGDDEATATEAAQHAAVEALAGQSPMLARNRAWWQDYWDRVPTLTLPNERLQFLYDYGMYKFAGFTAPQGVAATLQGPWIEEYRLPPWSSDYHFNINVQMCYQPGYQGNLPAHFQPLWEMITGWTETLQGNAKAFLGIDDGLMLPHAVSDDCRFICGYWGHSMDHGCTAWVAQMMFRHYRYTMDETFLRQTAYPFMCGTMRVYEEMLDRQPDGSFALAVGISPEYFTPDGKGWGADASFQLACIHRLCEDLLAAADALGVEPRPIWQEIQAGLPRVCVVGSGDNKRIGLWRDQGLDQSHRHHSHLAAITPFDIIDPTAEPWRELVSASFAEWIARGPGLWSGWCLSWAAALNSRVGNGEAAELWLEVFDRFFTNEGYGTLHDCSASGISLMGARPFGGARDRGDVMQMDGGMGATAVLQEMLLHTRRGIHYLFAGAPLRWRRVSFAGMRSDGAFLVSANRENGKVVEVQIKSLAGGTFRLANPWPDGDEVLALSLASGETITLTAQNRG